jgi:uncharacterized protein
MTRHVTAFEGPTRIASGELAQVALRVKSAVDRGGEAAVLVFDDETGARVDLDLHGTPEEALERLGPPAPPAPEAHKATPASEAPRGPGRPRLGVVAREVTLLPRHWEWLAEQPGGASVALRKLVEEARRANEGADRVRRAREGAYRFMVAMAGDAPGFEEATRALWAGDAAWFDAHTGAWPPDVRDHARRLAAPAFGQAPIGEAPIR